MTTDEQATQFKAVAKGTYLGSTISEMQIQVNGPSVRPNDPMNKNIPTIIIT